MKSYKSPSSVLFFIFLFSSVCFSQTAYNLNEGLTAAKSSGKKIFVDVYSGSDNWSNKMESEVFSSANVQSLLSGFVFVKLNADGKDKVSYNKKDYTSSELAKLLGATGYPAFVVMNPDGSVIKFKYNGEEVNNISGFIGEEDFTEMLSFFQQNKFKDTDLSTIFQN